MTPSGIKRLIVGILLLLILAPVPIRAQIVDEAAWCVSVWYPSSEVPGGDESIRANADLIDVVNPFWYTSSADGTLQFMNANAEDADRLAEWRDLGMTVIPTIASGEWEMLAASESLGDHIEQIVELVERMDYAGIDIDYEGFPLISRDYFSTFMEALSAEMHARGKLLTTAVHAKTNDAGSWEAAAAQDWTRIAPVVDVFTIMTYDYTSRNQPPGPLAPTEWVSDVLRYAVSITDLGKVRMGLPFYAYTWVRDNPPGTQTTWAAAQRLIEAYGIEIERNADMEAHITFKARGLPRQTFHFADSVGIDYKLQHILSEFPELGGVAIWGVSGEDPAIWEILRAARQPNCILDNEAA